MEIIIPVTEKKALHPVAIYREGLKILAKNFLRLCGIYLFVSGPISILGFVLFRFGSKGSIRATLITLPLLLLQFLLSAWGFVSLVMAINKYLTGSTCKVFENLKDARTRILTYILASALFMLLLLAIPAFGTGLLFLSIRIFGNINWALAFIMFAIIVIVCLLTFIYFFIRLFLYGVISTLENIGPLACLKQSHNLIKQHVAPVVGEFCLVGITALVFAIPLLVLAAVEKEPGKVNIAAYTYQVLLNLILVPFWAAVSVVMYKKLREIAG